MLRRYSPAELDIEIDLGLLEGYRSETLSTAVAVVLAGRSRFVRGYLASGVACGRTRCS